VKAIILAAGYATRLYPLTLNIPKPLLRVTPDKTVIDFIVDDLITVAGLDEIVVVTNHKFYSDFLKWAAHRKLPCRLSILDDGTRTNIDRLGAVGDIIYAVTKKKIDSDLAVIGGDNLFDRGFKKFFDFAFARQPYASLGVFDIKNKKEAANFGVVSITPRGRVVSFEEKPVHPRSSCVATCLYYFPKQTLKLLYRYAADPRTVKDAPGNYIRWLMQKDRVYGFALKKGNWHDIGHFDSYKEVVNQFTNKKQRGK
jgi:glucose-1-phosphate thymidylyltransferase